MVSGGLTERGGGQLVVAFRAAATPLGLSVGNGTYNVPKHAVPLPSIVSTNYKLT